jgi:tetratricopeptide (TPR) repeat protein
MAKFRRRRRPALAEPEEVLNLAQRLLKEVKRHFKWILLGLGVVLVVLVHWLGGTHLKIKQEEQAGAALARVRPQLSQPEPPAEALKALDQLIRDFRGTAAAREAELYRAHHWYHTGKYGEAAQAYEALLKSGWSGWNLLPTESLSYCYEGLGDYKKAAAVLQPLAEETSGAYQGEVLRRLAFLSEKAGDLQAARHYWQKLLEKSSNPALIPYLKEKLAATEAGEGKKE